MKSLETAFDFISSENTWHPHTSKKGSIYLITYEEFFRSSYHSHTLSLPVNFGTGKTKQGLPAQSNGMNSTYEAHPPKMKYSV